MDTGVIRLHYVIFMGGEGAQQRENYKTFIINKV
jgi:hypothetical protein